MADGAVVDERRLVGPPIAHVPIEHVEAGVELTTGKPPVQRSPGVIQYHPRLTHPLDVGCPLTPKAFWVPSPAAIGLLVGAGLRSLVQSVYADPS
jgi:hypothetical protein